ncbi:hypothetical protein H0H81_008181, partial [Sphagnurus paluster]
PIRQGGATRRGGTDGQVEATERGRTARRSWAIGMGAGIRIQRLRTTGWGGPIGRRGAKM